MVVNEYCIYCPDSRRFNINVTILLKIYIYIYIYIYIIYIYIEDKCFENVSSFLSLLFNDFVRGIVLLTEDQ